MTKLHSLGYYNDQLRFVVKIRKMEVAPGTYKGYYYEETIILLCIYLHKQFSWEHDIVV